MPPLNCLGISADSRFLTLLLSSFSRFSCIFSCEERVARAPTKARISSARALDENQCLVVRVLRHPVVHQDILKNELADLFRSQGPVLAQRAD